MYLVVTILAGLLVFLGLWQRVIQRRVTEQALAAIRDSRERGTHRGLTQHPQINPLRCIGCGSCVAACPEAGVLGLVDGVAHVIHASRCIGHARCEQACPVGALSVGLGDVSSRPDIPVLSDSLETSVPGVYIAGELSGIALIRNAVEQGRRAVDEIAAKLRSMDRSGDALDLLIVGAGPAGLAATLRAIEHRLRYATISQDEVGGSVRKYPRRKLTMTQPMDLPLHGRMKKTQYVKEELIELWDEIIERHRIGIRTGVRLTGISREGPFLISGTTQGVIQSRFVLLALGRRGTPRKLGVPGEESEKVLYQLIDAATYTGERLLVVGGGDSAVEAAMALAEQPGNEVTLSYRKPGFFRLKARNEERIGRYLETGRIRTIFSSEVRWIESSAAQLGVLDGEERGDASGAGQREVIIPNDYMFVFAGGEPPYPLLREIGIRFFGQEPMDREGTGRAQAA